MISNAPSVSGMHGREKKSVYLDSETHLLFFIVSTCSRNTSFPLFLLSRSFSLLSPPPPYIFLPLLLSFPLSINLSFSLALLSPFPIYIRPPPSCSLFPPLSSISFSLALLSFVSCTHAGACACKAFAAG